MSRLFYEFLCTSSPIYLMIPTNIMIHDGVIVIVHTIHLMNAEYRQAVASLKRTDLETGSSSWHQFLVNLASPQPFKMQRCQLVSFCHPGLTYIFNL